VTNPEDPILTVESMADLCLELPIEIIELLLRDGRGGGSRRLEAGSSQDFTVVRIFLDLLIVTIDKTRERSGCRKGGRFFSAAAFSVSISPV
jgi:hypothetical protein